MKLLGLDLDNSPHVAQNKSLRYALNITIDNTCQSYFNENGFDVLDNFENLIGRSDIFQKDTHELNIIGTIPTNIGVVLFCIISLLDNPTETVSNAIIYITFDNNKARLVKLLSGNFNFSIDRPIHGDYIYNYKEELIITFTEGISDNANETRIINLTNPLYDDNQAQSIKLEDSDITNFNLIPNVLYPELKTVINDGGNLPTGTYQFAIKYKLNDGTYTNYSPLTTTVIICGNYEEDYPVGIEINKNITISFDSKGITYKECRFAIVYIDEASQRVFETEDIPIVNPTTTHIVNELSHLASISLDDVFIKTVSYIKDNTLVNFNNRLIRGNVKTLDYTELDKELKDFTENNLDVALTWKPTDDYINTTNRYFKSGEVYLLYAGYYDYKGDLVNIHHIPWKPNEYKIEKQQIGSTNKYAHKIPYDVIIHEIEPDPEPQPGSGPITVNFSDINFAIDSSSTANILVNKVSGSINDNMINVDKTVYNSITSRTITKNNVTAESFSVTKSLIKLKDIPTDTSNTLKVIPTDYKLVMVKVRNEYTDKASVIINKNINIVNQDNSDFPKDCSLTTTIYDVTDIGKILSQNLDSIADGSYSTTHEVNDIHRVKSNSISLGAASNTLSTNINFSFSINNGDEKYFLIIAKFNYKNTRRKGSGLLTADEDTFTYFKGLTIKEDVTRAGAARASNVFNEVLIPNISIVARLANKTPLMKKYINSIVYFFVEHNINNSRILAQGFGLRDTKTNNFGKSQTYDGAFHGTDGRFYPFEYLYNKITSIEGKLKVLYSEQKALQFEHNNDLDEDIRVYNVNKKDEFTDTNNEGTCYLDVDIKDLNINISSFERKVTLDYINNDNSSQNNIAGESYYRIKDLFVEYSINDANWRQGLIADLINDSDILYSDTSNQKLQIASNLINITGSSSVITPLVGDTYIGYLTLRATTPSSGYRYGDAQHKELDSNTTVYRWVFTVPIESKFNILARYTLNAVDKSFKYHGKALKDMREAYQVSYKVDNLINSSIGKGYSIVYNENGIETFTYFDSIPGIQNHPYRIIRSEFQNAENANLNWRLFKSDNYKDMPFNRGPIIALKTDNKNLYIQQEYGLHLLQLRDTLSNTDEGTSYLGTADIFNMEPQEVTYSPSGYIGCQNYFDTTLNVIGYFVIDVVHKRIYNINGTKVSNLTKLNVEKWFENNLLVDANNPFKNHGRLWSFNEDNNILYLMQKDKDKKQTFTISFSPLINAWLSFHTYNPTIGTTNRNGMFWLDGGHIYAISKTNYGRYQCFDINSDEQSVNVSDILFIFNDNVIYNKLLNNITWKDRVDEFNNDDVRINSFEETANMIRVFNDDQSTNDNLVEFNYKWHDGSTGVNKINLWRFNDINDVAKKVPFIDKDYNLIKEAIKQNPKWYDVNKFICQFVYCLMRFFNTNENRQWELIEIDPEWIIDNRNNQSVNKQ